MARRARAPPSAATPSRASLRRTMMAKKAIQAQVGGRTFDAGGRSPARGLRRTRSLDLRSRGGADRRGRGADGRHLVRSGDRPAPRHLRPRYGRAVRPLRRLGAARRRTDPAWRRHSRRAPRRNQKRRAPELSRVCAVGAVLPTQTANPPARRSRQTRPHASHCAGPQQLITSQTVESEFRSRMLPRTRGMAQDRTSNRQATETKMTQNAARPPRPSLRSGDMPDAR